MKKFLSLVLALVMTMSLVTVSAGAKDFTDSTKIQYTEAVDVMSAVKVIDGYTDGSFNPSATLTRGAAAKIICNLILGPTTASALVADAAPYKDVPTTNVFAGYIAYCQKEGIISGYADGTFKPANSLTGYAFMKMLLGALGYDAETEGYTGANWSINVAKRAINIGLDDDLVSSFNGVKAVTREEACLYAFNTLKATMVEYDNNNSVTVNGITFTNKSAAKETVNTGKTDGNIDKDGKMQFAEKYFEDLKGADTTDEFMRPATEWKVKTKSVGTYADTPDASYTADTKISVIYADLGLSDGISKKNVTEYVDGAEKTGFGYDIVKGETTKVGGKGVQLDVYYDDDAETITFVEVNTYVAKVASVYKATSTKDAYVTLNISDKGFTNPGVSVGSFETEDFSKDQIVGYTYSFKTGEKCIESMVALEKVSGAMSAYTTAATVTVGGTKYDANAVSKAKILDMSQTVDKGTDVTVYLDAYGYALYVDADTNDQYAVVLDYAEPYGLNNARVKLLFTDGTTKKVDLDKVVSKSGTTETAVTIDASNFTSSTWSAGTLGQLTKYDLVSYSVNSDDEYKLTLLADAAATVTGAATAGTQVLKNGSTQVKVFSTSSPAQADGETIFLTMNKKGSSSTTYSTYTGISNVPSATVKAGQTSSAAVYTKTGDTAATVVFLLNNDNVSMSSSNKDVVYIKGNDDGSSYTKDLGTFYEYTAFINGEKTTIKSETAITDKTLVYGPEYSDKGIMTGYEKFVNTTAAPASDMHYVVGTKAPVNSVITLGSTPYAYAKDCKVYLMDVDGNVSAIDMTSIGDDTDDQVFFKTDDDDIITDLYVITKDAAETVTPGTTGAAGISADKTTGVVTVSLGYVAPANTYAEVTLKQLDNNFTVSETLNFKEGSTSGTIDFSNVMSVGKTYTASVVVGGTTYTTSWAYNG